MNRRRIELITLQDITSQNSIVCTIVYSTQCEYTTLHHTTPHHTTSHTVLTICPINTPPPNTLSSASQNVIMGLSDWALVTKSRAVRT
jgi:hypothetical protein